MAEGDRQGQQIGNYHLERLLGSGGFAEVYLGRQVYLDSPAAIKLLRTNLTQEEVEGFRQEARTLARLIHPHIVRILDFGLEGSTPFLVMDYAPNGTLRQRHRRGERLALARVVEYVSQAASALQYAHNAKIIHRDIKPENMLLGRQNEILIGDFGIAIMAQSTRVNLERDMTGTITYMAPEQIQAHPRPASDQYSLGVVVYEWLSGSAPFTGSFTEVVAKHMMVPPPPLSRYVAGLAPEVEQVVFTALAKDPAQRFASVQAFAHALEQAGKEANISTQPPLSATILASPARPHAPVEAPAPENAAAAFHDDRTPDAATALATPHGRAVADARFVPPPQPYYAPAPPAAGRGGPSRRALLLAALSAAGAVAAGGIAWALLSHTPSIIHTQTASGTRTTAPSTRTTAPLLEPLARDSFRRPDQTLWGTASDGLVWGGDANSLDDFSIQRGMGRIQRTANGKKLYSALLGTGHIDAEVKVTATLDAFNPSHIGVLLRYQDDNDYYKVLFDGSKVTILRRVGGNNTTLQSLPFAGQANTLYSIRFRALGSSLSSRIWQAAQAEPAAWMLTAVDTTFQAGRGGLRPQLTQNVTLHVILFEETRAG